MFSLDIYILYTGQHNTEFVKRNRGRMTLKLSDVNPGFSAKMCVRV